MELLATLPGGSLLRGFLVPDGIGEPLSLLRFYALHIFILPMTMLTLIFLHFYRVRQDQGILPYL
jgi:quinol-cytochrome oxidoreductase complex cytochrome b subunit